MCGTDMFFHGRGFRSAAFGQQLVDFVSRARKHL
jgi:hypothetical protein